MTNHSERVISSYAVSEGWNSIETKLLPSVKLGEWFELFFLPFTKEQLFFINNL